MAKKSGRRTTRNQNGNGQSSGGNLTDMGIAEISAELEKGAARIQELQQELDEHSRRIQEEVRAVRENNRRYANALERFAARFRGDMGGGNRGGGGGGGRRGGKREAILQFIQARGEPQRASDIAQEVGGKEVNVRQTLMQMVKAGMIASFKQDGGEFRAPGKGERGGFYGLPN